jgi:pimeloyl-ACP methyl ester carboxylesterase
MSVPAPVLILQGDRDVIRETNPLLAARFPDAANVPVENAGHFPWVEQPAAVAKVLLDFYSSVASATPARTS